VFINVKNNPSDVMAIHKGHLWCCAFLICPLALLWGGAIGWNAELL